jgi:hypothetical protein
MQKRPPPCSTGTRRRSAGPFGMVFYLTDGPALGGTTVFGGEIWRNLPTPEPVLMIPMPMLRTSPDDGGLYDEDQTSLVEVHR